MEYIAHTENVLGKTHKLSEHLSEVGKRARAFMYSANPKLAESAEWAGLLHDIGKYRTEFQEYIRGIREKSAETHHAVYGAALAFQKRCLPVAYTIAGHHRGLHDTAALKSFIADPKYDAAASCTDLTKLFETEVCKIPDTIPTPEIFIEPDKIQDAELAVRMIFSTLVDADFLDTESHYQAADRVAAPELDPSKLLGLLDATRKSKSEATESANRELNKIRNAIFDDCVKKAEGPQGFYSLTVPTGGGKTISSMAFALRHCSVHNLRRVIVVIPFLSIIEQNAAIYRHIFDPENRGVVIEHHSAVNLAEEQNSGGEVSEPRARNPLILAAENWDAPIVVTTSVQFLESLLANKPSRCRKLHNIARSVVIFDEVQTMPAALLAPLLSVFRQMSKDYGVSFVFSSATQPAFRRQFNLVNGFQPDEIREIVSDPQIIFKNLQRVKYKFRIESEVSLETIAEEIANENKALAVVNTRKEAFELFEAVERIAREDCFHLSSAMCPEHRSDVLKEINQRLADDRPCRLISTQVVEAGVDIDFPVVYRALGPLDSIVQAAGRCNREGRMEYGTVYVYRPVEGKLPPGVYRLATARTNEILSDADENRLATDPEIFANYFSLLYRDQNTGQEIEDHRLRFNFETVARLSKVIPDEGTPVVVPYKGESGAAMAIVNEIRERRDPRSFSRNDLRMLQRFMVNLRIDDFSFFKSRGLAKPIFGLNKNGEPIGPSIWVLDIAAYSDKFGVVKEQRSVEEFIL